MREGISLADYHVHPDFSFDAEGSIAEFCIAAEKKGLMEICFTSHFDTNPILSDRARSIKVNGDYLPHTVENFKIYVDAVLKAAEEYYPPLVRLGVEAGYYPGCEKNLERLFDSYPFYYRLGAVHEVDNIEICYGSRMEEHSKKIKLEDLADRYFALVTQAVETGLFDAIAHLDMYKKYGLKYYGDKVLKIHRGRIEPLFEAMVSHEVGLEINSSAIRKGHSEYYPTMEIVNMARSAGVRILAIGSDAHRPEEVGYDFEAASALAWELYPYCDE